MKNGNNLFIDPKKSDIICINQVGVFKALEDNELLIIIEMMLFDESIAEEFRHDIALQIAKYKRYS